LDRQLCFAVHDHIVGAAEDICPRRMELLGAVGRNRDFVEQRRPLSVKPALRAEQLSLLRPLHPPSRKVRSLPIFMMAWGYAEVDVIHSP